MEAETVASLSHRTVQPHVRASRRAHFKRSSNDLHTARRASRRARRARRLTSIVLAEEQHLVRQGIRCLLEQERDFAIVGETANGLQVLSLVQRLRPRVLIIAVAMPGLNGLEAARQVREQFPGTAVIILSMYAREQYVIQALKNGVSGYVSKLAKRPELVRAIRYAAAGQRYLSQPLSGRSIRAWLKRATAGLNDPYDLLTDRERVVLQLVAEGHTSTSIGARLRISPRTAEAHRASLMRKMRFNNLVDVVLFAIRRGILVQSVVDPLRY